MLTVTRTHSHGGVVTFFASLGGRIAARLEASRQEGARRIAARALADLPDHILRDIGRERDGSAAGCEGV